MGRQDRRHVRVQVRLPPASAARSQARASRGAPASLPARPARPAARSCNLAYESGTIHCLVTVVGLALAPSPQAEIEE